MLPNSKDASSSAKTIVMTLLRVCVTVVIAYIYD